MAHIYRIQRKAKPYSHTRKYSRSALRFPLRDVEQKRLLTGIVRLLDLRALFQLVHTLLKVE